MRVIGHTHPPIPSDDGFFGSRRRGDVAWAHRAGFFEKPHSWAPAKTAQRPSRIVGPARPSFPYEFRHQRGFLASERAIARKTRRPIRVTLHPDRQRFHVVPCGTPFFGGNGGGCARGFAEPEEPGNTAKDGRGLKSAPLFAE